MDLATASICLPTTKIFTKKDLIHLNNPIECNPDAEYLSMLTSEEEVRTSFGYGKLLATEPRQHSNKAVINHKGNAHRLWMASAYALLRSRCRKKIYLQATW